MIGVPNKSQTHIPPPANSSKHGANKSKQVEGSPSENGSHFVCVECRGVSNMCSFYWVIYLVIYSRDITRFLFD